MPTIKENPPTPKEPKPGNLPIDVDDAQIEPPKDDVFNGDKKTPGKPKEMPPNRP